MEELKKEIERMTRNYVELKRLRREKDAPKHIKTMYAEARGTLDGMFLALSYMMPKADYIDLCDWQYDLEEEMED